MYFGSMDDVLVAHKLRLLDVAAWLRQRGSQAALGLRVGIPIAVGTASCSQSLLGRCECVEYL